MADGCLTVYYTSIHCQRRCLGKFWRSIFTHHSKCHLDFPAGMAAEVQVISRIMLQCRKDKGMMLCGQILHSHLPQVSDVSWHIVVYPEQEPNQRWRSWESLRHGWCQVHRVCSSSKCVVRTITKRSKGWGCVWPSRGDQGRNVENICTN